MGELGQETQNRSEENHARDRAIMAFINLGERLKSFYNRENSPRSDFKADESIGAGALFNTIEGEIIPRLMLAHGPKKAVDVGTLSPSGALSQEDHEYFLESVMQESASAAHAFVNELLQRGIPREVLFLELLAAAARSLGEMWDQDLCDFTEVTIGLCRLHEILRKNGVHYDVGEFSGKPAGDSPRVILATACGDQHVFGVVMVAEFFRLSGWRVSSEPGASCEQLAEIMKSDSFDVLGLSAACSAFADDIAEEIKILRAASLNQDIKIIVGGRLFSDAPELVERVGADGVAGDAKSAPAIGKELLAANGVHC
ncbi:MAG: cobalamin B12-binding domain-containing protein [Pseudomonadota bacterium]